jgi:predicted DNA-binding transcriptional regulator AlpA
VATLLLEKAMTDPPEASNTTSDISTKALPDLLDGYLRPNELAQAISRSRRTIDRLERMGIGPPRVVIGGLVLYRVEAVRAWLQSKEQQSTRARKPATHTWSREKKRSVP